MKELFKGTRSQVILGSAIVVLLIAMAASTIVTFFLDTYYSDWEEMYFQHFFLVSALAMGTLLIGMLAKVQAVKKGVTIASLIGWGLYTLKFFLADLLGNIFGETGTLTSSGYGAATASSGGGGGGSSYGTYINVESFGNTLANLAFSFLVFASILALAALFSRLRNKVIASSTPNDFTEGFFILGLFGGWSLAFSSAFLFLTDLFEEDFGVKLTIIFSIIFATGVLSTFASLQWGKISDRTSEEIIKDPELGADSLDEEEETEEEETTDETQIVTISLETAKKFGLIK